ncbi:MAG TPA: hypothetical protein VLH19_04585 [Patescibacteria group bacterium]|nr:hypothetical protein [Patescibacteria group bacterium]
MALTTKEKARRDEERKAKYDLEYKVAFAQVTAIADQARLMPVNSLLELNVSFIEADMDWIMQSVLAILGQPMYEANDPMYVMTTERSAIEKMNSTDWNTKEEVRTKLTIKRLRS